MDAWWLIIFSMESVYDFIWECMGKCLRLFFYFCLYEKEILFLNEKIWNSTFENAF